MSLLRDELAANRGLERVEGHARALQRGLELGLILETALELVDLLLDIGIGDRDALLLGGLLDELRVDQVVERYAA